MVEQRIDGQPALAEDLGQFVLSNYGAFTSMVVEDGAVRGLDLHLARLAAEALELFGQAVPEAVLRTRMRQALAGRAGRFGLRVNLFSPQISLRQPSAVVTPHVLTTLSAAPSALDRPIRVQAQVYAREMAHLKHNATLGLTLARRRAQAAGFDDALFVDADGLISEGSVWNLGLIQGETVVWPQAPQLAGTGMALIRRGLEGQGMATVTRPVFLGEIPEFDGAFLCNATTPACAILAIDGCEYPNDPKVLERLITAWRSNPCQMI